MTIESGALEAAYVKSEGGSYGTLQTPISTDAIRHLQLGLMGPKHNREVSPQKRGTPDFAQSLPRRKTSGFNLESAFWEPSGALGTQSYLGPMLKAAFGAQTTPNLATTVASGASTTGATLTSGVGLAVGDCMVFTTNAGTAREITRLKTVAGAVVTFDALSASPDIPGAAVSGVNYKFTSLLTESLSIFLYHTGGGFKQAVSGAIVNQVNFTFDGSTEVRISMSGPAKTLVRTGPAQPGAHTTVGSPASGLVGNHYLDGAAFLITQAQVSMNNNEDLRNRELGTDSATGHMRGAARRTTNVQESFYMEDTSIIATAEVVGQDVVRLIVGNTNGSMVGIVMPKVEWEVPDIPTEEGPKIVSASGVGYATGGNDGLFAAEV